MCEALGVFLYASLQLGPNALRFLLLADIGLNREHHRFVNNIASKATPVLSFSLSLSYPSIACAECSCANRCGVQAARTFSAQTIKYLNIYTAQTHIAHYIHIHAHHDAHSTASHTRFYRFVVFFFVCACVGISSKYYSYIQPYTYIEICKYSASGMAGSTTTMGIIMRRGSTAIGRRELTSSSSSSSSSTLCGK